MKQHVINALSLDEIKQLFDSFAKDPNDKDNAYAWIQKIGSISIGKISKLNEFKTDDLIEARFFNDILEIHIFEYDGELRYIQTEKEEKDKQLSSFPPDLQKQLNGYGGSYFEETQVLRNRFGKNITLRHYLGYDEDGLACIKATALCGWKE